MAEDANQDVEPAEGENVGEGEAAWVAVKC